MASKAGGQELERSILPDSREKAGRKEGREGKGREGKVFASLGLCKSRFFTKTHSSKLAKKIDVEGFLLDLGYASF